MGLYKVESNSKKIYLIQEFVTVMADLIMDYSIIVVCVYVVLQILKLW